MTKSLVFGAAGFMGSHLLDYLLEQGHDVYGIDNYSIGRYEHPRIIKADCLDKPAMDNIIKTKKPEIVYFLTAWAHEGLSHFCPVRITENNYNAFLNVLVPSIKYGVKRIVVTSSMSVYGDQVPPFTEDLPRKPTDVYGVSKSSMEITLEILSKVHGIEYVIIRPHNVYGPRQAMHDPYRNVVAIFINRILQDKDIFIYGDGEQKRAFSYIDDVTPYLAKAGWENVEGEIINIGPIEDFTINQLADGLEKAFGKPIKRQHVEDRPLDVKHAWCSHEKASRLLGYRTSVSFQEGLNRMVKWAKQTGPVAPEYLKEHELEGKNIPKTWKEHLI